MTYPEKILKIKALAEELSCEVLENEPLCRHTTVKVGGACDLFIVSPCSKTAAKIIAECRKTGLYSMILGNGSNVLFSDDGFRGAVVTSRPAAEGIEVSGEGISADAGVQLSAVCRAALGAGLQGLEFAYGIPGTVGGAIYMNAGAYGGEMKDVADEVTAVDFGGQEHVFSAQELELGYRTSRFERSGEIITRVKFKLSKGDPCEIRAKMEELMARRKSRQPLEYPSFGSAFKRPEGTYAGLVIEQSGLKGRSVGGAQISEKHANFIINRGGATAGDYLELISLAQRIALEKTGCKLEPEVRLIPPKMD